MTASLARRVVAAAHLTGEFTLRSGRTSAEYFDKYRFESDPALLAAIASAMAPLVPAETHTLAGLELGGIPLVTMLSQLTGLPALFVRKEPKPYGTRQLAEGGEVAGRTLTLVEDVVTSGGAVLAAAAGLRERGAAVGDVVCVIDRGEGGAEALAAVDLRMHPLFTRADLDAALDRLGVVEPNIT